jgi:hypothetical protein
MEQTSRQRTISRKRPLIFVSKSAVPLDAPPVRASIFVPTSIIAVKPITSAQVKLHFVRTVCAFPIVQGMVPKYARGCVLIQQTIRATAADANITVQTIWFVLPLPVFVQIITLTVTATNSMVAKHSPTNANAPLAKHNPVTQVILQHLA